MRKVLVLLVAATLGVFGGVALADDPDGDIQSARDLLAQADALLAEEQAKSPAVVTETIVETTYITVTPTTTTTIPPTTTTTIPPPAPACDFTAPAPSGDGTALKAFLDSVPDGTVADPSNICLQPGASYTITNQLTLTKNNWYVDGQGASITSTNLSLNRNVWNFEVGSNIRVDDMTLTADISGSVDNGHGINLKGVQGFGSTGVTVDRVRDDGVRVGFFGSARTPSRDVVIEGCTILLPRRHAISVVGAEHVQIRGCDLNLDNTDAGGTLIDVEPLGGDDVDDVLISGNTFGPYSASSSRRTVQLNSAPGSVISNVTVSDNDMTWLGLLVNSTRYIRFSTVSFTDNRGDSTQVRNEPIVKAFDTDGLTVTGNSANLGASGSFVLATNCTGVTQSGNVDTT